MPSTRDEIMIELHRLLSEAASQSGESTWSPGWPKRITLPDGTQKVYNSHQEWVQDRSQTPQVPAQVDPSKTMQDAMQGLEKATREYDQTKELPMLDESEYELLEEDLPMLDESEYELLEDEEELPPEIKELLQKGHGWVDKALEGDVTDPNWMEESNKWISDVNKWKEEESEEVKPEVEKPPSGKLQDSPEYYEKFMQQSPGMQRLYEFFKEKQNK